MTDTIILKFDGGSRGNPGIAGAGAVIYKNDIEVACVIIGLDEPSTNNQAEYTGLIEGLKLSLECGYKNIVAYGDSLLVVNHVTRVWKCKSPLLKPLLEEATNIIKQFDSFEIRHIYRKDNSRADELANEAMDNISINLKD
jgi:ribonuclease HI